MKGSRALFSAIIALKIYSQLLFLSRLYELQRQLRIAQSH